MGFFERFLKLVFFSTLLNIYKIGYIKRASKKSVDFVDIF